MLIEKVRQRTFLYDTKSPDCRDHDMRANAWEGIGKELKIKRKFYVSARDVRIVRPRLKGLSRDWTGTQVYETIAHFHTVAFGSILLSFKCRTKFRLFNDTVCSADCIAFYATSSLYVRNQYQNPARIYHLLKVC